MDRKGDWMTTYSGRQFWPLDPRSDEVNIEDIAHALSMMCRFGGHCKEFYSVAQHSCIVADLVYDVDVELALTGLLHDAAEAYIGDIIRPLKRSINGYKDIERAVEAVIYRRFGLVTINVEVKRCDDIALRNEHRCLINDGRVWVVDSVGGPNIDIAPWAPPIAKDEFIRRFATYSKHNRNNDAPLG